MAGRPSSAPPESGRPVGLAGADRDYRRLRRKAALAIGLVSALPLLFMTSVNYRQYQQALLAERTRPVTRLTNNTARSIEHFLSERKAALDFVVRQVPLDALRRPGVLSELLANMKRSFGGFVDLGVIDRAGVQIAYTGPYALEGDRYADQEWFAEVTIRGVHVSKVFTGHRGLPHFVIAIRHEGDASAWVLRATIDLEVLTRQLHDVEIEPVGDAFMIDAGGVLQTPSRLYGDALRPWPLSIPPPAAQAAAEEVVAPDGEHLLIGYAAIERSPFVLVLVGRHAEIDASWIALRAELLVFLLVSLLLILAVIIWGTGAMVRRIKDSDERRAALLHHVEYTNRMAAIGRLASGVAHEVNNPLAIINEKAGLMQDLLRAPDRAAPKEKLLGSVESILRSVDRCAGITHRLLGFAKQMHVTSEHIDLPQLIAEVFGFLEREALYRGVKVEVESEPDLPLISSDRGQLQQVFLNLLNNALAAVPDGGSITVNVRAAGPGKVAVDVVDDGTGIAQEHLERIFEPFFTTRGEKGTGLGLSITYGIVEKLGGDIRVSSELGKGTTFTVELPVVGSVGGASPTG